MAQPYKPFRIQADAHRALLVDGYRRAFLFWSRRCFAPGTKVTLASGVEVPIENVRPGMWVISYNEELGIAEPKEVLELHCFGVDEDPKPMIELRVNGQTTTSTYDHEFYTDRGWVPAYQLAWGAMAPSQRLQLQLLCEQYGQDFDNQPLRWLRDGSNEASTRRLWVLQDGTRRQDHKSTSGSRPDVATEPLQQTANQSYRQRQEEQPHREPGVGDKSRKLSSYDETGETEPKLWREMRDTHTNGKTSLRDTRLSKSKPPHKQPSDEQDTSREISSLFGVNPPYFEGQDLEISSVKVLPATTTYDLTVADNHNYVVHDLLVHNTGKTRWSLQQLVFSCMLNQGPHHIVFKEYQQAETIAWNQYLHTIPEELIAGLDKRTLTITFNYFDGTVKLPDPIGTIELHADYTKPPASIRLLGSDKAESHRGGESYGMIFDEYQDQDQEAWDFVYKYFLATTNGWAVFMGTAKPDDWWIEMQERAEKSYDEAPKGPISLEDEHNSRWYWSKATWRENPNISPKWIETERKEAEKEGKLGAFLQETELIPFTVQGAVYPMFDKKIHVIKPDEVPQDGTDYVVLDFGFAEGHPMAMLFIRITRDDVWYQWDEIHGIGIQIDDAIAEMNVKMGGRMLTGIIADSARPDLIEYMQSKGYPVIPAPKKQNSVASGIQLLSKRLRPKIQVYGDPKPNYFVVDHCKATIYDFGHYRYKEVKLHRSVQENPEKKFDDTMDALRYLELFFKYGIPKNDKLPSASLIKEFNDYGLL